MIIRDATSTLEELAKTFKAIALMGPRQSGKTTLAKACFPGKPYVSLENPVELNLALADPIGFLSRFPQGAILDEVQRAPQLFSYLQQILDERPQKAQFILSGSNNFLLLESITQSLAGRVGYIDLLPFSISEWQRTENFPSNAEALIFSGGYPAIAAEKARPELWFPSYIRTYVERDVRQIKNITDLALFQRFVSLCAGRIGQQVNYTNLGNDLGLDYKTVQSWMSILQASYVVHLLPPFYKNFNKRIKKASKLYFYDTGLACFLLGIKSEAELDIHSFRGPLFENFVINELLKNRFNRAQRSNLYYYRDSSGHEVDVVIDEGQKQVAIEIKSGRTLNDAFFDDLKFWGKLTQQKDGVLIYAGDIASLTHMGYQIENWRALGRF